MNGSKGKNYIGCGRHFFLNLLFMKISSSHFLNSNNPFLKSPESKKNPFVTRTAFFKRGIFPDKHLDLFKLACDCKLISQFSSL